MLDFETRPLQSNAWTLKGRNPATQVYERPVLGTHLEPTASRA